MKPFLSKRGIGAHETRRPVDEISDTVTLLGGLDGAARTQKHTVTLLGGLDGAA